MHYNSVAAAVKAVIKEVGDKIILGMPLGLGKPNIFANEIYRHVSANSSLSLTIFTALSLTKPKSSNDLQQRFLQPFVERVYGDYEELDYLHAARSNSLPNNIAVHEFFVQPASELGNAYTQQNYINSNYTHAPRDMNDRKVNVIAQTIACREENGEKQYSLSCNPEITLDMVADIAQRKAAGEVVLLVGQVHKDMPFMQNSAQVEASFFDLIIDEGSSYPTLMSTPNMPVSMAEHFIGLAASSLVKDGGTLQIGIGALGDAVASALLLRHNNTARYQQLLNDSEFNHVKFPLVKSTGELTEFVQGLYGCSEMFTYGLFELFKADVLKRKVTNPDGTEVCIHGGFFLGPNAFYQGLRELSAEQRSLIDMTRISFVNDLYGDEELKRSQRIDARFINTAFTVTLLGAAAADQLADGRMLSGVGGQYNFVAQAHELAGARSVLLVRSTREKDGERSSNIVWSYGHTTIPRHLRDVVVTEYGVADLRGRTDGETIAAMLNISDSEFQQELMVEAKAQGKLPKDYEIPAMYCNNTPQRLQQVYQQYRAEGEFAKFPLGSDFTYVEESLLAALTWLESELKLSNAVSLAKASFIDDDVEQHFAPHLARMGYHQAENLEEKVYQKLLLIALQATAA